MEHNGASFTLARIDVKAFDHLAQTGFALQGKHRDQTCRNCHNQQHIPSAARAEIKAKDLNRTFLGLRTECTGCHQDQHRGQLGPTCTRCHSQEAWKPAAGFNHSATAFPLTGMHQEVACQKCHGPKPGDEMAQYGSLPFRSCDICHADPHKGGFKESGFRGTCAKCHNTSGWKNNRPSSNFDHATTKFPLTGKHAERACADCHKGSDFHRPIAHERCQDCHQDPHSGQFATRAAGADCGSCHADSGFKPARFSREQHQKVFALDGKHATLDCAACHKPEGRSTVYKLAKKDCADCHVDKHSGQFAAAPYSNRCELCHTVAGFQPAAFTVTSHEQTRFPLTGKHAAVECRNCHKAEQFHFTSLTCSSCHSDPHGTKLACETCHSPDQWKQVRPFEHKTTGFHLDGAHASVKCADCHKQARFANASNRCGTCHAATNIHGDQFSQAGREEDCAVCHSPTRWNTGKFDHDGTRFPLDVAHRNVDCSRCHKQQASAPIAGKPSRLYRGTPVRCVECH